MKDQRVEDRQQTNLESRIFTAESAATPGHNRIRNAAPAAKTALSTPLADSPYMIILGDSELQGLLLESYKGNRMKEARPETSPCRG